MQLKTSPIVKSFHNIFKSKFNFEEYESQDKATLFFGMYRRSDFGALRAHKGPRIVWFTGTDSLDTFILRHLRDTADLHDITYIAESNWIKKDIEAFSLKYETIHMINSPMDLWRPAPLGNDVYWYCAGKKKYDPDSYRPVLEGLQEFKFHTPGYREVAENSRKDVPELYYNKCFASLRPMNHDGFSQTVAEIGLMGRYSIWNGIDELPCALKYNDTDDIIRIVKELSKGYDYEKVARETKEFLLSQEEKFINIVSKVCGEKEADNLRNKHNN